MHSIILQISTSPISEDTFFDFDRYQDDFVPAHADSVCLLSEEEKANALEEFSSNAVSFDAASGKMSILDKEAWFKPKYEEFIQEATKLSNWSFEDFLEISYRPFSVSSLYQDEYGIYVDVLEEPYHFSYLQPLDRFLRSHKDGEEFYIGSVFDYHV